MHFVLLGTALFAVYHFARGAQEVAAPDDIVVTRGEIERLVARFEKTWRRPPTAEEREGLIEARIREEVYYCEAIAARLDRDDAIVRRRMQQKLEFLLEDIAGGAEPTEADLREFIEAHPAAFMRDARVTFRHVYFNPSRGTTLEADVRTALARLESGEDQATVGDALRMVEPTFQDAPQRDVARTFGAGFAREVLRMPIGKWSGPVESGFGSHLVFLDKRTEGTLPELRDVRDAVAREWAVVRRRERNDALYRELRRKYAVTVETD